ncbi:hypothetical protein TNCV_58241 [Trichonephila clavipes]|nr:hypothetical protein TNCV_58241 [Trichonephila clavipes]
MFGDCVLAIQRVRLLAVVPLTLIGPRVSAINKPHHTPLDDLLQELQKFLFFQEAFSRCPVKAIAFGMPELFDRLRHRLWVLLGQSTSNGTHYYSRKTSGPIRTPLDCREHTKVFRNPFPYVTPDNFL